MTRVILDASVALAWCFADEAISYADTVLDLLIAGGQAVVPPVWAYEVANALLVGERRGRIGVLEETQFLQQLSSYPVTIESLWTTQIFGAVLTIARETGLTVYDAAYLELALREGLPLATINTDLRAAARKAGVPTSFR